VPRVYTRRSPEERFWEKVDRTTTPDGCWPWLAGKSAGYGSFRITEKLAVVASRFSWELINGPIPEGLFVCHRCDNPPCVNPAHLFLGDHKANANDMVSKGRGILPGQSWFEMHPEAVPRGARNGQSKLTEDNVMEIRRRYAEDNVSMSKIGKEMGVSQSLVSSIVRGEKWAHIKNTRPTKRVDLRLSDEDVKTIRRRVAAGEMQKTLAAEFGVCSATVSEIVRLKKRTRVK
jgi:predicted transcriptional regulator